MNIKSMQTPVLMALIGAVLAGVLSAANAETDASEFPGRGLFIQKGCYQCHGYEGQGGAGTPVVIAPNPMPLKAFIAVVRRPYGVMPAYAPSVLSDDDLRGIREYLASIPSPPKPESLRALSEQ